MGNKMEFEQIDVTGCRITGALTIAGGLGPKHHGIIIGRDPLNGVVYIAELLTTGYSISSFDEFKSRYWENGKIQIESAKDATTGLARARRALNEIKANSRSRYNLITNNCESFVNRAIEKTSESKQVITAIGVVVLISGAIWLLKRR